MASGYPISVAVESRPEWVGTPTRERKTTGSWRGVLDRWRQRGPHKGRVPISTESWCLSQLIGRPAHLPFRACTVHKKPYRKFRKQTAGIQYE